MRCGRRRCRRTIANHRAQIRGPWAFVKPFVRIAVSGVGLESDPCQVGSETLVNEGSLQNSDRRVRSAVSQLSKLIARARDREEGFENGFRECTRHGHTFPAERAPQPSRRPSFVRRPFATEITDPAVTGAWQTGRVGTRPNTSQVTDSIRSSLPQTEELLLPLIEISGPPLGLGPQEYEAG